MTNASLRPRQSRHVAAYECPADIPPYVPPLMLEPSSSPKSSWEEKMSDEIVKVEDGQLELEESETSENEFVMPSCAQVVKDY